MGLGCSKYTLPIVILLHAFSNAFTGLFQFSTPIEIAVCYAAYRCWKTLEDPYEDEF